MARNLHIPLWEGTVMRSKIIPALACFALCALPSLSQTPQPQDIGHVPIYRVTVVERTVKAINYEYRKDPTMIDFRGTVLMPKAKGDAVVQSKQGRTAIDAGFQHVTEPSAFGPEYLTYVLWALTPDGRPHNLGEIIPNSLDHSRLQVTTDLQAFALIVTAEPYSAVRQPSDVVILENQVRGDTTGIVEQVNARYELLPRGHYSWEVPATLKAAEANGPRVSTREYEELIEIYQAQNAVGAAKAAGAGNFAPEPLAKAETLLREAQQRHDRKADRTLAIQEAREAAQSAEDARLIAEQRQQQDRLAKAEANANAAQQAKLLADASRDEAQNLARSAQVQIDAAQAQAAADREARARAEHQAQAAQKNAAEAQAALEAQRTQTAVVVAKVNAEHQQQTHESEQREQRSHLLGQLNSVAPTRDTAFGLVVTIPDPAFTGPVLRNSYEDQLSKLSRILNAHPALRVEVQGHSDSPETEAEASRRAQTVGDLMLRRGLPSAAVSVRSMGDSRLIGPNATAHGREENRRVEIVISGDEIGSMALWDHPYSLTR
jgi:outer membrane protein OmpA-like peptidoglycan-associated protein